MEEFREKYRKQLYRKEKLLKCAMGIKAKYHKLNKVESKYVEGFIFNAKTMKGIKETYESLGERLGSYFIFRVRNRLASEMLELIVLLMASYDYSWVEKCRANDKKKDIKINGVGYDLKIEFSDPNEYGRLEPKYIRNYNQRKIYFLFSKDRKDYIFNNFIEFFRHGELRLEEILEDIQKDNYREITVVNMNTIKYCL